MKNNIAQIRDLTNQDHCIAVDSHPQDWNIWAGDGDFLINMSTFTESLKTRDDNIFVVSPIILSSRDISKCQKVKSGQKDYQFAVLKESTDYSGLQIAISYYLHFLKYSHTYHGWDSSLSLKKFKYDEMWLHIKPVENQLNAKLNTALNDFLVQNNQPRRAGCLYYYVDALCIFKRICGGNNIGGLVSLLCMESEEDLLKSPVRYLEAVIKSPADIVPKGFIKDNFAIWQKYYAPQKIVVSEPVSAALTAALKQISKGK